MVSGSCSCTLNYILKSYLFVLPPLIHVYVRAHIVTVPVSKTGCQFLSSVLKMERFCSQIVTLPNRAYLERPVSKRDHPVSKLGVQF
jgi:hypothetical protein